MEGIAEVIKPILDKVVDFFHIFDFSYIISGFATTTSIFIWMYYQDVIPDIALSSKQLIVFGIMSCYILGLLSFGVGRFCRRYIYNKLARIKIWKKIFRNLNTEEDFELINQQLNTNLTKEEFDLEYLKKWAKIRTDSTQKESYKHLNRYWVMTATADGLAFSSIITFTLAICSNRCFDNHLYYMLFMIGTGIAVVSFIRQANKSELNQKKELFITASEYFNENGDTHIGANGAENIN